MTTPQAAAICGVMPTTPQGPRFLTTAEVAEMCRTTPETCRYWRHVGKGPRSFRLGRKVLYAVEDVEQWITKARQG